MFLTFDKVSEMIDSGTPLHIAGTEELLKKLPKGNWIGGSTEYFMTDCGGKVSNDSLYVTSFSGMDFKISSYNAETIKNVAADAYDNGITIVIIPIESEILTTYAQNAAHYEGMFIKNIVGWISGRNFDKKEQTPITVNGLTGIVSANEAAVLHIRVPDEKNVNIGIINIFEQDESAPAIEFTEKGYSVGKCLIDGKETVFADYITQNNIDTRIPLVGNYSGAGVNVSFDSISNGSVHLCAPVFKGIKYRIAKPVDDYVKEFAERLASFENTNAMFSCNCVLNFLYGELEGKNIDTFLGPMTFGEIAYQILNQTLVYVTIDNAI